MIIIESGKHKGKVLSECPTEYLMWAATHEKNFAKRNQWISRDAKRLLERREKAKAHAEAVAQFEAQREARMAVKAAQQIVRASQGSTEGNLNVSRGFSLMR